MKKAWVVAVAAGLFISMGSFMNVLAAEGEWKSDSTGWWYQYEDGKYPKHSWEEINGYRYYFDNKGYMATGWTRISGYYYCFSETGEQIPGWCYNDEKEKWYYFNTDGSAQKNWLYDNENWYWFSASGTMVNNGYRSIDGAQYYFYEDGQMAANQYVGTYYMDAGGQRNKRYDIVIEGKGKEGTISSDEKDQITYEMKNLPRAWVKSFAENGWKFLFYPEKAYFSAPESDGYTYYIYHKLDSSYQKIKFCKADSLPAVFGEYIGFASGCGEKDSKFAQALAANQGNIDEFVEVPDFYGDDLVFYFGQLVSVYLNPDLKKALEEDSPEVCQVIKDILYP